MMAQQSIAISLTIKTYDRATLYFMVNHFNSFEIHLADIEHKDSKDAESAQII